VKIHNDGPDWDQHLLRIARAHPRRPIIIAHSGLGHPMVEGARIAAQADNIYAEMCSSFAQLPAVREFIRTIPSEKMLFGTDAPLLDPAFVLGTYQDAIAITPGQAFILGQGPPEQNRVLTIGDAGDRIARGGLGQRTIRGPGMRQRAREANLDEDAMWPTAFALTQLTAADEARIGVLVKRAMS